MNIIILILIVFSAISVMTGARVIIKRRKIKCESKKEEEKAQEEQEKLAKKAVEELQKPPDVEEKAKEETESAANKAEDDEAKRAVEERLRKEREESIIKEKERLEKIKAEEEKIEREAREKSNKEKAERERLEAEKKKYRKEREAKAREEEKTRLGEINQREEEEKPESARKPSPGERGGRPRGPTKRDEIEQLQEKKTRTLRPEIVCWNKEWEWIVGIEVPEKFASPNVIQNGESIKPHDSDEARYSLRYIKGIVKVTWNEGEQDREIKIPVMEDGRSYLIFKMRKNWKGLGRVVRRPTAGYYLAIVPCGWKRDEEMSGSAPVAPENVQISGYKAHFFALRQNENTSIAFIDANGGRIPVKSGSSSFQLIGKELPDSSEDMGPLFGEEPPCIKATDEQIWDNVGVIVIGEEGSGRNRWRTQFSPQESMIDQKMPDDLANRQGGWYFVRIYDKDNNLLDSMDFRFSAGLKSIQIMNPRCLPEKGGYCDVEVKFNHQVNCNIEPESEMEQGFEISRGSSLTIITIPPKPYCDKTHWTVVDADDKTKVNAKTKITILIERVWWNAGDLNGAPANWRDRIIALSRQDFTATSEKALWLKFPRKRWVTKIEVGFNRDRSRPYNVDVEKEVMAVPLRDFCDAEEIENRQEQFTMKIWFLPEETHTYEAIVLRIPAELPRVELKQQGEQLPTSKENNVIAFNAIVKCPGRHHHGKFRQGRGFNKGEIDGAGLTMKQAKNFHLAYDKRRNSSHLWNINRLKAITERCNKHGKLSS